MEGKEVIEQSEARQRFEYTNGQTAYLEYEKRNDNLLDLKHTYVPRDRRGQGLGGRLVKKALEYAREEGYRVIPSCPFVRNYLEEHREFADLIQEP